MVSARFEAARDRLEGAVGRLEQIAAQQREQPVGDDTARVVVDTAEQERLTGALSSLRRDYEQLQQAARDVSARLDRAIERVEILVNGGQP